MVVTTRREYARQLEEDSSIHVRPKARRPPPRVIAAMTLDSPLPIDDEIPPECAPDPPVQVNLDASSRAPVNYDNYIIIDDTSDEEDQQEASTTLTSTKLGFDLSSNGDRSNGKRENTRSYRGNASNDKLYIPAKPYGTITNVSQKYIVIDVDEPVSNKASRQPKHKTRQPRKNTTNRDKVLQRKTDGLTCYQRL